MFCEIYVYENFNNIFSPSKGLRFNLTYDQFLKVLGSDKDFGKFTFFLHYYQPIIKNAWTAGFRIESQHARNHWHNMTGISIYRTSA